MIRKGLWNIKVGDLFVESIYPDRSIKWYNTNEALILTDDEDIALKLDSSVVDKYIRYINMCYKYWEKDNRIIVRKYNELQIT